MMNDIARLLESGDLPAWFPDDTREDALQRQRDLLRRPGMTLDALREAVEEIIEVHCKHFTDPNYVRYEYRSVPMCDGKPDFSHSDRTIRPLARYLYAATLDEKDGLALLIGNDHAGRVENGDKYSAHQSVIASNNRGKVGDNESGNAFEDILINLANEKDKLGDFIPAPNLWESLFSKLEAAGAKPKLHRNNSQPRKSKYTYTVYVEGEEREKTISRGRFETRIGEYRKK